MSEITAPAHPAPTSQELVAGLLRLLDVDDAGPDAFTGHRRPGGKGRMFGGQVIAQGLVAAERTVAPDRPVHSLHAYFLRGGDETLPVDFTVERDLDGGSFANRRVVAAQAGKPILTLLASFHRREEGAFHADPMPDVPPPEGLRSEAELRAEFIDRLPEDKREIMLRTRPIELRPVEARHWMGAAPREARSHTWFRAAAALPDDPRVHRAVLAYASDMNLLGTCTLPHGLSWITGNVMAVSLDHAIWFHDDFRADEWLLYVCDSPWAGGARGFNRGRIYTRDGRYVASVAQEGLIRPLAKKT
ncbi:palmitoyl-CoA hydrolase [Novosphingobium nitrogenifigens DSM 19370]|uniref:Acyl-CoA thioesterase 2 n=1 Tax=Novosphingobium nitrogenifigens DSM 19370 TaxID=983920 RepID=F1ZDH1_9SPHN|nr:acyl-CoA thioesterase II [Novosphingobium nitrogenifigens]EGD57288.1 palmitoyl-CoA hydrolase [Novosphingobium nitrogenifigens DSM 19370]